MFVRDLSWLVAACSMLRLGKGLDLYGFRMVAYRREVTRIG